MGRRGQGSWSRPISCSTGVPRARDGPERCPAGQIQFDYKSLADGRTVTAGTEFRLGSVLAANADLDFALITVPDTPGVLPVGGYELESSARPRGWIQVPYRESTPQVGSGLVMAHHPQAGPLQLTTASDAVAGLSEDGRYLYHRLTTQPGSAGAPIFGSDLELIAIHLGWKPDAPVAKGANYALRLGEVRRELGRLGLVHRLASPWPDQIEAPADDGRTLAALRGNQWTPRQLLLPRSPGKGRGVASGR